MDSPVIYPLWLFWAYFWIKNWAAVYSPEIPAPNIAIMLKVRGFEGESATNIINPPTAVNLYNKILFSLYQFKILYYHLINYTNMANKVQNLDILSISSPYTIVNKNVEV